jgi:hypothetical protein
MRVFLSGDATPRERYLCGIIDGFVMTTCLFLLVLAVLF